MTLLPTYTYKSSNKCYLFTDSINLYSVNKSNLTKFLYTKPDTLIRCIDKGEVWRTLR